MAKTQSLIESAFMSAAEKLAKDESGNFIGDLYVQVDAESGELRICDDEEHLTGKIAIFDWVNSNEGEDAFNKRVTASVKAVLIISSTKDIFNVLRFMKPLSVNLTDEDLVIIEELFFIDDDMLRLDDSLLKNLDVDLSDFLASLLIGVRQILYLRTRGKETNVAEIAQLVEQRIRNA